MLRQPHVCDGCLATLEAEISAGANRRKTIAATFCRENATFVIVCAELGRMVQMQCAGPVTPEQADEKLEELRRRWPQGSVTA